MKEKWQIWIDTGGTFTDCIARSPRGETLRAKVLSSSRLRGRLLERLAPARFRIAHRWPVDADIFEGYTFSLPGREGAIWKVTALDPWKNLLVLDRDLELSGGLDFEITAHEEAPVLAARLVTATPLGKALPPLDMRLGSTRGTNALLERKGARVALLITRGFADLVTIGTQQRPHLFQLDIPEPLRLYDNVLEVDERLAADGSVLTPLAEAEIDRLINELQEKEVEAVAVALLHAYRNSAHERLLMERLQNTGFRFVSASATLTPSIKLLPRTQTALVNAYLSPVIHDYLHHIRSTLGEAGLLVMTSAGGLVPSASYHPKDSLLSGPAGGVVGAARIARRLGIERVLTLDMGGTSTDTARYDGHYDYEYITHVEEVEMLSPTLSIETVAAGGGSICTFDGARLTVGPESAGAQPGPACYGAGGPLTITDVNLLLGKLDPSAMGIPIDLEAARAALDAQLDAIAAATGARYEALELLRGYEQIANEKMAEAIRRISVAKGFDPQDYALLAFGGAGGLHACGIAGLLGMDRLVLPFDAGLLSAYGIGHARVERFAERQVLRPLEHCLEELPSIIQQLEDRARGRLTAEGFPEEEVVISRRLAYLRFRGQESTLEVPYEAPQLLAGTFENNYRRLFGHYPEKLTIELESLKVLAATREPALEKDETPAEERPAEVQTRHRPPIGEVAAAVPVYRWEALCPGDTFTGPAILLNRTATAFIEPGWRLTAHNDGNALAERIRAEDKRTVSRREAVELELFTNRFKAIAEEMGAQLQRTAFSVNIKERLDFSCAVLDPQAELLVNAPHIPVHLGSLGVCARLTKEKVDLGPGDVVITNHPKYGGSHLPDVTLMSAVYTENNDLIGYVINRAHHAEIGGARPGSMPPDAETLIEEGVVIPPTYLVKGGEPRWQAIEKLLTGARWPTRSLPENLADINAALASLRSGEAALRKMVDRYGLGKVHHYMAGLKDLSRRALAEALASWRGRIFTAEERLDDGHRICVSLAVKEEGVRIDFTGTSPVHPGNLNANIAIVYSAVIYVLRLLCKEDIPLNEGLMQHVRIELPGCFLHPAFSDDPAACPAVVGGNTEVSQRLVDTLLKALGVAACSQGTMNNFLFGNQRFGYYETIGGGAGAGPGFSGRSAVHQHMTNTRITDPEEMERRYPVRLHRFAVRRGSGGAGRWRGGDGIVRELEFLEPMEVTLLSQHRVEAPYGMQGGQGGQAGEQFLIREDGAWEKLGGVDSREAKAGERVLILTPGGGGWGEEG